MSFSPRRLVTYAVLSLSSLSFAESYVLDHVRIVNPGQPVVEDGMIIVSGDKFVHVGARTSFEAGYSVIDCTGLTAYPGFIDAYSRAGLSLPAVPTAPEAPNPGTGPLASMWHENRRGVYADLDCAAHVDSKSLAARHSQGVTASLLASGRGAFGGLSTVVSMRESDPAPVVLKSAFQELGFAGGGGGYPGSAMARIALMRQLLFDGEYLVSHPQQDGAPADAVMSAIGDVASGLVRTLFRADTEREIQRALNLGEEFGLKMTIYGTDAAWQHATELKKRNIPVIVQAAFPREPRIEQNEDPARRLNDPPLEYLKEQHDIWKEQCLAVVKLHQAGVPFAFSSDGDTDIFLANVRKHVALGLPKEAALNALTKGAAEVLGVSDKLGTIQNGKLASLVLMDGDFAAEATKVKIVLVDGKKFEVGGN